jgi:hypothetical protein
VRTLKSVFDVIGALMPVLYCGGLIYYFLVYDYGGSVQDAETYGLGPILLEIGVVGLLLCIPLIWRISRLFARPRSPGSGGRGGPDTPTGDDEGGFDADAAIARYMARRSVEAVPSAPAVPPAREGGGPARRRGFGRKIR